MSRSCRSKCSSVTATRTSSPCSISPLNGEPGNQRHAVAHGHESLDRLQAGQFNAHVQTGSCDARTPRLPVSAKARAHCVRQSFRLPDRESILASPVPAGAADLQRRSVHRYRRRWSENPDRGAETRRCRSRPSSAATRRECGWPTSDAPSRPPAGTAGEIRRGSAAGTGRCIHSPQAADGRAQGNAILRARWMLRCADSKAVFAYSCSNSPAAVSDPSREARSKRTSPRSSSKFSNHLADSGLATVEMYGSAGESALFGYREKGFQLREIHRHSCSAPSQSWPSISKLH